jgi:hypothetical protein
LSKSIGHANIVYRLLSSLCLIAVGVLILVIVRQGFLAGKLPAGVAYFRAYRPNRADNPIAFHFFLALYFCGGMALVVWGILALFGGASPIRLS